MKIIESQVSYKLSVVLSPDKLQEFQVAFRSQSPIKIPELENKTFFIQEISVYHFLEISDEDKRHCFLSVSQEKADRDEYVYSVLSR